MDSEAEFFEFELVEVVEHKLAVVFVIVPIVVEFGVVEHKLVVVFVVAPIVVFGVALVFVENCLKLPRL